MIQLLNCYNRATPPLFEKLNLLLPYRCAYIACRLQRQQGECRGKRQSAMWVKKERKKERKKESLVSFGVTPVYYCMKHHF
jgi:hypothetical protein